MNDTYIVTAYSVIDDLLKAHDYTNDMRATIGAAEILTVAVVAAKYFQIIMNGRWYSDQVGRHSAFERVVFQPPAICQAIETTRHKELTLLAKSKIQSGKGRHFGFGNQNIG